MVFGFRGGGFRGGGFCLVVRSRKIFGTWYGLFTAYIVAVCSRPWRLPYDLVEKCVSQTLSTVWYFERRTSNTWEEQHLRHLPRRVSGGFRQKFHAAVKVWRSG